MRKTPRRLILSLVGFLIVGYLLLCSIMFTIQDSFIFHPDPKIEDPRDHNLPRVSESRLEVDDGTELTVWTVDAAPGQPTIVYFHGNSQNLAARADRFARILSAGFGLYAMSYRGYSGSGGAPSERAIISDAVAAFDAASETASGPLIVYGESLGTGVAIQVATERRVDAVILEAPYTSVLKMARMEMPWLPVALLLMHPFRSDLMIADAGAPVLILHGTDDRVIPHSEGAALYDLAVEPKELITYTGAHHGNLWDNGSFADVIAFLEATNVWPANTR